MKVWKKVRKVMGLRAAVALLLAAVLLVGCGRSGSGNGNVDGGSKTESDPGDTSLAGEKNAGGDVAYGRYVEEEMAMPERVADGEATVSWTGINPEGKVEIMATVNREDGPQEIFRYVLQEDDSWKEEQEEWMKLPMWSNELLASSFSYDAAGNMYITAIRTAGENYAEWQNEFYRVTSGASEPEKLDLGELTPKAGELVSSVSVGEAERIMLYPSAYPSNIQTGNLNTGKKKFEFMPGAGKPLWYGSQILLMVSGKNELALLSGDTGEEENRIPVMDSGEKSVIGADIVDGENIFTMNGVGICGEPGKGIWVAGAVGLMYRADGGSKWEVLLEPDVSVMGMPSCYVSSLMKTDDTTFYLSYRENYQPGLVRIQYRENVAATQNKTLTIYSLTESESIRQAMVEFQREHLDVKVEYRAVMSENSSVTREDCIQALNTELLAGKGADILVMDSLPVEAYVEKGILEDLSGLLEELKADGSILPNIADAAKEADQGYVIPTRLNIPVWIGSERALTAVDDITKLAAASAQAEHPFFGEENYNYLELFRFLYNVYGSELVQERKPDREKLTAFLTAYCSLAEESGTEEDSNPREVSVINSLCGGNGELGYLNIRRMNNLMIPATIMREFGHSYSRAGNSYESIVSLAVNRSSEEKDLAFAFIRKLLSESIQDAKLDGLPVNAVSLEKKKTEREENLMVGMHYEKRNPDGTKEPGELYAEAPTEEELTEFFEGVKELTGLHRTDETMKEMIEAEIPALWRGEKNVNAVSESLYRKISMYLAE